MRVTYADAKRKLKMLYEDLSFHQAKTYSTQAASDIKRISALIRKLTHAVSTFRVQTIVPGSDGMTIDQVELVLKQMTDREAELLKLLSNTGVRCYSNQDVQSEYDAIREEKESLAKALGIIKHTQPFEVPDAEGQDTNETY